MDYPYPYIGYASKDCYRHGINHGPDALVLDFVEWIAASPRRYCDVMEAWKTSCPRLTIWEDAIDQGLVQRCRIDGELSIETTEAGRDLLARTRRKFQRIRRAGCAKPSMTRSGATIWLMKRLTAPACSYVDRHLVHEVDSPQAFAEPAARRPAGQGARQDAAGGRSQRADLGPQQAQSGSRERGADRLFRRECRAVRPRILRRVRPAAGHLPRRRPRAGLYAARHDDRLRRQPHHDPRRLRRARLRHRHLRGRARARDPDADPAQVAQHARGHRRQAAVRTSPPRTSSSPSSARSAPPAASVMRSNFPARRSARCRWKAA